MRLRRAVPQNPPKSSVPPRLPLCKGRPLLTHLESTLLQVFMPLHFNSPGINTYKKPGGGCLSKATKFCNSLLFPLRPCLLVACRSSLATASVTPFPVYPEPRRATLADHSQLTENPATLSPLPVYPEPRRATLTGCVKPNPCVCHSYKKHGGWGGLISTASLFFNSDAPAFDCRLSSVTIAPHPGAIYA
jgi:hypothetical protein